jgi:hypothetical protein
VFSATFQHIRFGMNKSEPPEVYTLIFLLTRPSFRNHSTTEANLPSMASRVSKHGSARPEILRLEFSDDLTLYWRSLGEAWWNF